MHCWRERWMVGSYFGLCSSLLRTWISWDFLCLHFQVTSMKSRYTLVMSLVQGLMLTSSSISLESMETQVMGLKSFLQKPCPELLLKWAVFHPPGRGRQLRFPLGSPVEPLLLVTWFVMAFLGQHGVHLVKFVCVMCFQNKLCLVFWLI